MGDSSLESQVELTETSSSDDMKTTTHKQPTKQWLFLDYGLDDFRGGAPKVKPVGNKKPAGKFVSLSEPVILNNEENLVKERDERAGYLGLTRKPKNAGTKLSKKQAVLSTQLPRSERRKAEISTVETRLQTHPLALYPHLLKAIPIDLVENVGHLLESDVNHEAQHMPEQRPPTFEEERESQLLRHSEISDDDFLNFGVPHAVVRKTLEGNLGTIPETAKSNDTRMSIVTATSNSGKKVQSGSIGSKPYKWLIREEDKKKPVKTARELEEEESARKLNEVTTEFANWANQLSTSTPNVDPSTIKSLFASGYESKPALTVPIQVYELSSLPAELRITDVDKIDQADVGKSRKPLSEQSPANEKPYKPNYGSWYISPQSWNHYYNEPKRDPDEILLEKATDPQNLVNKALNTVKSDISDPNLAAIEKVRIKREMAEQAKSIAKNRINDTETEIELAQLHSARAFRDYLDGQPHLKKPDFMNKIIQIQDMNIPDQ